MSKLSNEEQTKITRVIIKSAVLMLEYGAESILVEQIAQRLGKSLGMDSVEISMIPSAIVLTTLKDLQSVTTTRRVHHKPINLSIVCDVQKMTIDSEKKEVDADYILDVLKNIQPKYYNPWLIVFMVGLSCASFAYLRDVDLNGFFITFVAASVAMMIRQELAKRKFILIITFGITAFFATAIASLASTLNLSTTSNIVLSASVLLLVPGIPFINSMLDATKGYLSMAWGRWMQASLLTFASAIGIIIAMSLLNLKGW